MAEFGMGNANDMNEKASPSARAERMRKALRANLRRRKQEVSPQPAEGEPEPGEDMLERRRDPLAPRIRPAGSETGGVEE
jgi:hypothetical protein